jgi:phosphoglycolate phosphatase
MSTLDAAFDLVMFDLDGTLVDSLPDIAAALNQTLRHAGIAPLSHAQVAVYVGDGAAKLVQRALPDDTDPAALAELVTLFRADYAQHLCVETRAYPGIEAVLRRLSSSLPLAVLTNKPSDLARPLLAALGLDGFFAHVIGDGDGFARKPDAEAGRWLLRHHGVDAPRALVIGDGLPDIRFAHALGAPATAVTWGYVTPALQAAERPTWSVDAPEQLLTIVFPEVQAG